MLLVERVAVILDHVSTCTKLCSKIPISSTFFLYYYILSYIKGNYVADVLLKLSVLYNSNTGNEKYLSKRISTAVTKKIKNYRF